MIQTEEITLVNKFPGLLICEENLQEVRELVYIYPSDFDFKNNKIEHTGKDDDEQKQ